MSDGYNFSNTFCIHPKSQSWSYSGIRYIRIETKKKRVFLSDIFWIKRPCSLKRNSFYLCFCHYERNIKWVTLTHLIMLVLPVYLGIEIKFRMIKHEFARYKRDDEFLIEWNLSGDIQT